MFNPPNTYYTDQRLTGDQVNENTISHFKYLFKLFLHEFNIDNVKVYMKQISRMINERKFFI